jgi:hypothetical protein
MTTLPNTRVQRTRSSARFSWRCFRCARDNDEPVRYGWCPPFALRTCGLPVEQRVERYLTGRVIRVSDRS